MSTLTGHIEFRSERLPARIIHDEFCISTAGVARAVGRHPGRLRSIVSSTRKKLPAVFRPGKDIHTVDGGSWWTQRALRDLAAQLTGPAEHLAIELARDLRFIYPALLPDEPEVVNAPEPAQESPAPAADPPG